MIEGGIDANASLDGIEFQLFPSQNRYEACVCWRNRKETVTSGPLAHLLQHSDKVSALHSNGSDANFKLEPPENIDKANWFSKSTLLRFSHLIASSNMLNITNAILKEIHQLEEAKKFHVSIYAKGPHPTSHYGETDSSYSNGTASTPKAATGTLSSDASKDELLRALDLRLTALREELSAALDKAAGAAWSPKEFIDLEKFSHYFGATELRKILLKFIEMNQWDHTVDFSSDEQSIFKIDSGDHGGVTVTKDFQTSKPSQSDRSVKYGGSPAKAAQVERQCSSESEESSYSSEEDRPSAERSRTPIRCASPRRSASPMRRIQIGRSGSRRPTPLTIRSLTHFPARERIASSNDAAQDTTDEEGSEEPSRKSDNSIRRMSVQDAVKLFESKQKEQIIDIQKARSLLNASIGANKAVLRRWSAGMGESSNIDSDKLPPTGGSTLEGGEAATNSPEAEPEFELTSHGQLSEPLEMNGELNSPRERGSSPEGVQEGTCATSSTADIGERLTASAEWSRHKEEELNQLLKQIMETKPVECQDILPESSKNKKLQSEARGGFYDHYKEKRDMKLRGEMAGKRAEKEKQFRVMQRILDERKAAMASKISSSIGRGENAKKPQKALKNASQSTKSKSEASKPSMVEKRSQKASPLPATRKSWPSTPSPRGTGTSPAKTPGGMTSAGTTSTRHRAQPKPAPQSSQKVEGSRLRSRPVKPLPVDVKKNTTKLVEKKQQTVAKTGKTAKTKLQTASVDPAPSTNPSLYSKVTKKSSVVPLESKPFLRKGSGIGSGVGPTTKRKATKSSPQPDTPLRKSEDPIQPDENVTVPSLSGSVIEQLESDVEAKNVHADTNSETLEKSPQVLEEAEVLVQVMPGTDNSSQGTEVSPLKTEAEETLISPAAWVEIEEQDHQPILCNDSSSQIEYPTNFAPVEMSSPRVRHSLSQMLLKESSEPDVIEWGNAENPPSMIYQKDFPKGLKRLLKFARKSKTDANSTGWSTPSVFSEGDDDAEESKAVHKRNAEILPKKATLHGKIDGHQKKSFATSEEYSAARELSAQGNMSRFTAHTLSQKLQEGHASASMTTTKASRSFFSLSAFKGGR